MKARGIDRLFLPLPLIRVHIPDKSTHRWRGEIEVGCRQTLLQDMKAGFFSKHFQQALSTLELVKIMGEQVSR